MEFAYIIGNNVSARSSAWPSYAATPSLDEAPTPRTLLFSWRRRGETHIITDTHRRTNLFEHRPRRWWHPFGYLPTNIYRAGEFLRFSLPFPSRQNPGCVSRTIGFLPVSSLLLLQNLCHPPFFPLRNSPFFLTLFQVVFHCLIVICSSFFSVRCDQQIIRRKDRSGPAQWEVDRTQYYLKDDFIEKF